MANFLTRAFLAASLLVAGPFVVSGCGSPAPTDTSTDTGADVPAPSSAPSEPAPEIVVTSENEPIAGENILATGQFTGLRDHVVTGSVKVVEVDGAYFIQLGDDFSLDDAPDPKVGLGADGYDPSTKAGELLAFTGASSYQVPAGVTIEDYNEVHIWCERFNVPLGVASLVVAQ